MVYFFHPIMNSFWVWERYKWYKNINNQVLKKSYFFCKSMKMKKSVTEYFLILLFAPPPELEMKILILFLSCIYFIPAKLRITKEFYLPSKMKKKQVRKYKDYQKILSIQLRTWTDTKTHNTQICTKITKRILSAKLGIWAVDKSPPTQNVECLPVYPYILLHWVVEQFGTGIFGTKIVKTGNLAPRRQTDNFATQ